MNQLRLEDFRKIAGSEFTVESEPHGTVIIELATVEALPSNENSSRPDPFSLVFLGPRENPLQQQIYRMHNESLGELDIFVVPLGPDATGRMRYEAIFN